jgi:transposase
LDMIRDDCTITLGKIQRQFMDIYNVSPSKSTIFRRLDEFDFFLKETSTVPERNYDSDTTEMRFHYAENFRDLMNQNLTDKIYYIDEVGFNFSMRRKRGWSLRGHRAIRRIPLIRTRNISVCCAMSKNGTFCYQKQSSPFEKMSFKRFVVTVMAKLNEQNITGAHLVMDNVAFHRVAEVREVIESSGHNILFLPPYSPFLNPIENMFSKWKTLVKSEQPINEDALISSIDSEYLKITPDDCAGYFRHMLSFIPQCLKRADIVEW